MKYKNLLLSLAFLGIASVITANALINPYANPFSSTLLIVASLCGVIYYISNMFYIEYKLGEPILREDMKIGRLYLHQKAHAKPIIFKLIKRDYDSIYMKHIYGDASNYHIDKISKVYSFFAKNTQATYNFTETSKILKFKLS